ncbi:unnamed protein product [Ambrosiozyma monospora]|uniref:Unnamed protein product n=1 Tax=Ambrosiozyma monospora TaxID=43982 RepID=A0ACB5ST39_AMBMO|nr:unnamed protein product [Ambrosiozyma monospora]
MFPLFVDFLLDYFGGKKSVFYKSRIYNFLYSRKTITWRITEKMFIDGMGMVIKNSSFKILILDVMTDILRETIEGSFNFIDINLFNIDTARFNCSLDVSDNFCDMQMVADYFDGHVQTLKLVKFEGTMDFYAKLQGLKEKHPLLNVEVDLETRVRPDNAILPNHNDNIVIRFLQKFIQFLK